MVYIYFEKIATTFMHLLYNRNVVCTVCTKIGTLWKVQQRKIAKDNNTYLSYNFHKVWTSSTPSYVCQLNTHI
jgi:hypothetical protein